MGKCGWCGGREGREKKVWWKEEKREDEGHKEETGEKGFCSGHGRASDSFLHSD